MSNKILKIGFTALVILAATPPVFLSLYDLRELLRYWLFLDVMVFIAIVARSARKMRRYHTPNLMDRELYIALIFLPFLVVVYARGITKLAGWPPLWFVLFYLFAYAPIIRLYRVKYLKGPLNFKSVWRGSNRFFRAD